MKHPNDISTIFLFSGLNEKETLTIRDFSTIRTYSKGEIIFFDTEPFLGFYGILEGLVKLYKISAEGREHILHIMYSGSTFGEVPMFEEFTENRKSELVYPANAMALEDNTTVIKVPEKPFMGLIKRNPDISMKMLASFAKRLRFLNNHIESVTLNDVSKRLSKYILIEIGKKNDSGGKPESGGIDYIELDISKYDLASHLGTITETLSRALRKLQSDNLIEVYGKKILIKNTTALKNYTK